MLLTIALLYYIIPVIVFTEEVVLALYIEGRNRLAEENCARLTGAVK